MPPASDVNALVLPGSTGGAVGEYFDPLSGRTFVVSTPSAHPFLWDAFLCGALNSYRRHGVESALEFDAIRDGKSTALFFAAIENDGQVVAGARVQRQLLSVDDAHARSEWTGHVGQLALTREIDARLPAGVIEVKAVWVDNDARRRRALTDAVARTFVHAINLMNVRYAMCTASSHAIPRWASTGAVVSATVPAVPYPDDRYLTSLLWWDRHNLASLVARDQLLALARESAELQESAIPVEPSLQVA